MCRAHCAPVGSSSVLVANMNRGTPEYRATRICNPIVTCLHPLYLYSLKSCNFSTDCTVTYSSYFFTDFILFIIATFTILLSFSLTGLDSESFQLLNYKLQFIILQDNNLLHPYIFQFPPMSPAPSPLPHPPNNACFTQDSHRWPTMSTLERSSALRQVMQELAAPGQGEGLPKHDGTTAGLGSKVVQHRA